MKLSDTWPEMLMRGGADEAMVIDKDHPALPPSVLSQLVRGALATVSSHGLARLVEAQDEDPAWSRMRQEGRGMAIEWMLEGMLTVIRRHGERRGIPQTSFDKLKPKVDLPRFKAIFGFPEGGSFQDDCLYLTREMPVVMRRMEAFASEFEVMYADYNEAFRADAVFPRSWSSGIHAPWPNMKRCPVAQYTADQVRIMVQGALVPVEVPAPVAECAPIVRAAESERTALAQSAQRVDEMQLELEAVRQELRHERSDGVGAQYRELLRTLRGRIQVLESRLSAAPAPPVPVDEPLPTTWDALPGFAASRLGGRVVISRRAYRAVRSSVFRDVSFVYDVLQMLAEDYVPMRHGQPGARERFEANCKRLRVRVSGTGEAVDSHRTSELYRVNHLGRRLPLDMHVAGNSSFNPRDGFRLYFNYFEQADEPGVVIVGHMPSHLDSTLS